MHLQDFMFVIIGGVFLLHALQCIHLFGDLRRIDGSCRNLDVAIKLAHLHFTQLVVVHLYYVCNTFCRFQVRCHIINNKILARYELGYGACQDWVIIDLLER